MNRKERLTRCYFNQEIDRPAVYSRTGFPADDPSYDRLKALLREATELKAGWWGPQAPPPAESEHRVEPIDAEWDRRIDILHTPRGPLQQTFRISRCGQPGMHETHYLKSLEDVDRYLSLPQTATTGPVDSFFSAIADLGDAGIVEAGLGLNPAGTVVELMGSEAFALFSVTDRDRLHALCERELARHLERLKFLLGHGVGPFFSMLGEEYLVPPLHGERDFYDFNVRYDKPIVDQIHQAGGRIHIHSHGAIRRVFQGFLDLGADVLHPFEPPPQGDLTAAEAKALAQGRLCLEGNLQINRLYEASPAAIREETRRLIDDAFADRKGLIVSPSASPYIRGLGEQCLPQYEAMIETVLTCAP